MLKKTTILILALLIATLSGCASTFRFFRAQTYLNTDLIEASHDATEELKDQLCRKIPKGSLIVVSTLLNVKKNPNETSSFGRLISHQVATSLQNSGYQIIALDLPIDLFMMEDDGELLLSDEQKALLRRYNAAVMVGGIFAPGRQTAYVTLRAVNRFTRHVIAATDFSVALGPDVKNLLRPKDSGSLIPVGSPGSVAEPIIESAEPTATETTPNSVSQPETVDNNPAAGVKNFPPQMN
jgi:hypothetical protein